MQHGYVNCLHKVWNKAILKIFYHTNVLIQNLKQLPVTMTEACESLFDCSGGGGGGGRGRGSTKRSHDKSFKSRVSDQNGVSPLYIMLEIHHSGQEPSK